MISTQRISDKLVKTFSSSGMYIKPIRDRLNKPFNPNVYYEEAIDIIVDGQPRFDYVETNMEIKVEEELIDEITE